MASFERNPGKPVRATFYLLVTIEVPDRARSHRQQIEPLDIQSYLSKGAFRMVIFPMRVRPETAMASPAALPVTVKAAVRAANAVPSLS